MTHTELPFAPALELHRPLLSGPERKTKGCVDVVVAVSGIIATPIMVAAEVPLEELWRRTVSSMECCYSAGLSEGYVCPTISGKAGGRHT
jgi:hypothetical protein